jgi:lipopolysaccharide transport protein LptA
MNAMAAGDPRPPFQRLRRLLLGAFAAVLLAVAGLYVLGRRSAPEIIAEESGGVGGDVGPAAGRGRKGGRPAVVSSEGFDYEQRVGERSAFRLHGQRFSSDKEGLVALQGVTLDLTREDGSSYRIESRQASWDPHRHEARLAGDVHLSGGRDLSLEADRLDLVGGGQTVVSRGPVRFAQGDLLSGRASGMRMQFENDHFLLQGAVRVAGRRSATGPALGLDADSVLFERPDHLLHATGSVVLTFGGDRLQADQVDLQLSDDDGEARRAEARGQVVGELGADAEAASGSGRSRFEGATLVVDFAGSPARPAQLELEPAEGQRVRAMFQSAAGDERTLEAAHLLVSFADGKPEAAAATGGAQLTEVPAQGSGAQAREARADSAEARFDQGEVSRVTLVGGVDLRQGDQEATGDRCEADVRSGTAVLTAEHGRVRAVSPRGELRAPRVAFEKSHGAVHATGGVFAELAPGQGNLQPTPTGGAERLPTRVEASEAETRDDPRTWTFRGDVRASQGESLLFADELTGAEPGGTATATGHVRTVWKQAAAQGGDPIETNVSADRLDYDRSAGHASYSGSVRARQGPREMSSAKLEVELDGDRKVRRMIASGGVEIDDRQAGRKVNGTSADHDLEARTILIEGSPVVLTESDGTTVRGQHVLYDLAAGTARVLPEEKEATPP